MVDVEPHVLDFVLVLVLVNVQDVVIPVKAVVEIAMENVKAHVLQDVAIVVMEVVAQVVQDVMVVVEVIAEIPVLLHAPNNVKTGVEYRVKGDVMESVLVAA